MSIHVALDYSFTHTEGAWRRPGSWVGYPYYTRPQMWEDAVRVAERACIDMIFFGDGQGIPDTWESDIAGAARHGIEWPRHDMSPLIPIMGRVTDHIGFCLTYSATFMHPYFIARHMASIAHVVGGPRMAMNLITSARLSDAGNYGFDELLDHGDRYDRTDEFVDVCRKLWASVEPEAVVMDPETGMFCDPERMHYLNHDGPNWKVRGPLNMLPPPGGDPCVVQAGASPRGLRSFARNTDIVFASRPGGAAMREYRSTLDQHLVEGGRRPEEVIVLWPVYVFVADSMDAAKAQKDEIVNSLPMEAGGIYMSHKSGFDFSTLPPRFTIAEAVERIEAQQGSTAYLSSFIALGPDTELSRDDFCELGRQAMLGGRPSLVGTPEDIADQLEELHDEVGDGVGYMIEVKHRMPGLPVDFCEKVVPILQQRGVYRTEYAGSLRENLGLVPRSDPVTW